MIPENVTLAFDPETEGEIIQKIFADKTARTLWTAIKPGHLTSQYFNEDCLVYAKEIERAKKKSPLTAKQLLNILSGVARPPGRGIIGPSELDFTEELLPFVRGERNIAFTINARRRTEEERLKDHFQKLEKLGLGRFSR